MAHFRSKPDRRHRLLPPIDMMDWLPDDDIAARKGEEKATGKRRRGRKPKEPDPNVDPDTVANPTDPDSGFMKTRRGCVHTTFAPSPVVACCEKGDTPR